MHVTSRKVVRVCLQSSVTNEWRVASGLPLVALPDHLSPFWTTLCVARRKRPRGLSLSQTILGNLHRFNAGEITSGQNVAALRKDIFLLGDNMLLVTLQYISTPNSLRILFINKKDRPLSLYSNIIPSMRTSFMSS